MPDFEKYLFLSRQIKLHNTSGLTLLDILQTIKYVWKQKCNCSCKGISRSVWM